MNLTQEPHIPDVISFDLHFEASWALLLQALEILFTLIFVKKSSAKSLDILSIHITGVTQCVKIMFFGGHKSGSSVFGGAPQNF